MEIKTYKTDKEALRAMTEQLILLMKNKAASPFNLALSGGGTAEQMFILWADEYKEKIEWGRLRFFWVDERCVPPADPRSNYGNANRHLFEPLAIPDENIHRIQGEEEPGAESVRYSWEVKENLSRYDQLPIFDAIILGVGEDLHTASIFPSTNKLLYDSRLYSVAQHPETGEFRITMTGPLILNNAPLLVPVLGEGKQTVKKRLNERYAEEDAPAAYILNRAVDATVYMVGN